jgi:hypothetical protein
MSSEADTTSSQQYQPIPTINHDDVREGSIVCTLVICDMHTNDAGKWDGTAFDCGSASVASYCESASLNSSESNANTTEASLAKHSICVGTGQGTLRGEMGGSSILGLVPDENPKIDLC